MDQGQPSGSATSRVSVPTTLFRIFGALFGLFLLFGAVVNIVHDRSFFDVSIPLAAGSMMLYLTFKKPVRQRMDDSISIEKMPRPTLYPGEQIRECIGNHQHSLGLTTLRVFRIIQRDHRSEARILLLKNVQGVRYSRSVEYGFLVGACAFLPIFLIVGMVLGKAQNNMPLFVLTGIALGVVSGAVFVWLFLFSEKVRIRIVAAGDYIEVDSHWKDASRLLQFLEKVQEAAIQKTS